MVGAGQQVARVEKFTPEQKRAIGLVGRDLCVSAGAGSGKTGVLVERFVRLVKKGIPVSEILCITFTEKATAEMKQRVAERLHSRGMERQRQEVEFAYISTIDSFCSRLLRENALEAGLDPEFTILEEYEARFLLGSLAKELLARWGNTNPEGYKLLLEKLHCNDLAESSTGLLATIRSHGFLAGDIPVGDNCQGELDEEQAWWEKESEGPRRAFKEFLCQLQLSYQKEKHERRVLDFSDLVEKSVHLLQAYPVLREERRRQFRHILVDEFQDTNNPQRTLLELLKREGNLFVVGDAQQSIYGFRNADVEVFLGHRRQTEETGGEVIHLDSNFRSRAEILAFVNALFKGYWGGDDSTEWRPLIAGAHFVGKEVPSIEFILASGGKGKKMEEVRELEAKLLASRIKEIVEGGEYRITRVGRERGLVYGDCGILLRTFTDVKLFETALEEMGIPFFVVDGRGLYDAREIIDLINLLRVIDNPRGDLELAAVLRSPLVGITDNTLFWLAYNAKHRAKDEPVLMQLDKLDSIAEIESDQRDRLLKLRQWLERFRGQRERLPLASLIEDIVAETNYDAKVLTLTDGRQCYANLRKFIELTRSFEKRGIMSLREFLKTVQNLRVTETRESEAPTGLEKDNVVKIMTIHKAKGLQFPVAVVADLGRSGRNDRSDVLFSKNRGLGLRMLNPLTRKPEDTDSFTKIYQEIKAREEKEEERVLYVALTRAEEHLILSGSYTERTKSVPLKRMTETLSLSLDSTTAENELTYTGEGFKVSVVQATLEEGFPQTKYDYTRLSGKEREKIHRKERLEVSKKNGIELPVTVAIPRQASNRDYIYSVTEIMSYHSCPQLYYFRYRLGLPSIEAEGALSPVKTEDELEDSPWIGLGNAAHRALELYRPAENYNLYGLEEAIQQALKETLSRPASVEEVNALKGWVKNFYASREGKAVMTAKEVRREMPFIFNYQGIPIRGKIDLLFSPRREDWYLLDYKSSSSTPYIIDSYSVQMRLYSLAMEVIFGRLPGQAMLFFLPEGKGVAVDITPKVMSELDRWLGTFFDACEKMPSHAWSATLSAQVRRSCKSCEYKRYCER